MTALLLVTRALYRVLRLKQLLCSLSRGLLDLYTLVAKITLLLLCHEAFLVILLAFIPCHEAFLVILLAFIPCHEAFLVILLAFIPCHEAFLMI